jgi:hypothetical protein
VHGLAIQGGKSLPPGAAVVQTRTEVAVPPQQPELSGAPSFESTPAPQPVAVPRAPAAAEAPAAAVPPEQDAKAILAAAMAADKAGRKADALELYQKALEADAVYADGKSIDRGLAYDRIGALRAGAL